MTRARSTKVAPNLVDLARRGERVRFNGFWLADNPRDRAIAEWLDQTPQAAAVIKALIYSAIAGGPLPLSAATMDQTVNDEFPDEIPLGPASNALMELD